MKYIVLIAILATSCSSARPVEDPKPVPERDEAPQTEEPQGAEMSTIELGQQATKLFYEGDVDALHARFSDEMKAALPGETWSLVQSKTTTDLGPEIELVDESSSQILNNRMYHRTVLFEKTPKMKLVMTWGFLDDGTITGFNLKPHQEPAPSDHLDYETKTSLVPPFEGEWTVIWGGRTVHQNYHAVDANQRFALDMLVTGPDQLSYSGDRTKNESYFAFGKKVLAPGAGKIIAAENGVADNIPGKMNPAKLAGNFVLIDHGNGEYSLLAHFKEGSLAVAVGDEVKQGQLLGLCGNTGNSSEPHIHYHMQDSAEPLKGAGLPIHFDAALIDGALQQKVELVQGQRVSPPGE